MTPDQVDALRRREAMLTGVVREIMRIAAAANLDPASVPIADALDGRLRSDWALVVQRARALLGTP